MRTTILLVTILFLLSCDPQQQSTVPQNSVDTVYIEKDQSVKPGQYILEFESDEAINRFRNLFRDSLITGLALEKNDNYISIAVAETQSLNIIDTISFAEIDLVDSTKQIVSDASIRILTTLPFSPFFVTSMSELSDTLYEIKQISPVSYSIRTVDAQFDALSMSQQLQHYAQNYPLVVLALLGEVEGLREFIEGTSPTITGIAPISPSVLGIKTTAPFTPQIENLTQILPGSNKGYQAETSEDGFRFTPGQKQSGTVLSELTVTSQTQADPIIALSTKSVDAAILYKKANIRVAQSRFSNMKLYPVDSSVIYAVISLELNDRVSELYPKIHGALTTDRLPFEAVKREILFQGDIPATYMRPAMNSYEFLTIQILANESNPLERIAAQNLVNELKNNGISAELHLEDTRSFTSQLINRNYDIVIGTLPAGFFANTNNRTVMNTMYDGSTVVPLMSVPHMLAVDSSFTVEENSLSSLVKHK